MRHSWVGRLAPGASILCVVTSSYCPAVLAQDDAPPPPTSTEATEEGATESAAQTPEAADGGDVTRAPAVIVSARKWEEDVQNVPQSVTVLPESFLEDSGIGNLREASYFVPNLFINEFSSRRLSFPTMRGIGSGVGDPAVTTYIDGVPQLSVATTNIPLLNVERIEFLRGPQGTLYGRNSIGGVMHIVTSDPSNRPTVTSRTTAGTYDLFEQVLGYSGPLVEDELYFSVTGMYSRRDGYTVNEATWNDVDHREQTFGQASLLWTPSDQSSLRLTLQGDRSRDGGFVLAPLDGLRARPHRINQDYEGIADRDIRSASLAWNYEGDSIDFTSITALQGWNVVETSDFDFTAIDGIRRRSSESQQMLYQELRFSSPADRDIAVGENADFRWLVGASAFVSDSERTAENNFRPAGAGIFFPPGMVGIDTQRGDFDDIGAAIFGQGTLTLEQKLELTAGMRFDHESKRTAVEHTFRTGGFTVLSTQESGDRTFNEFLPMFSAAYHVNDDVMTYGRVAKGFKAGGFNLAAPAGGLAFEPETSWTYEAGVKTSLLDDRMQFNASVFYIDWEDLQLSLFDAMVGGYIDNAAEATSQGFELELNTKPCENVDVFAGLGYTDATFDSFTDSYGSDVSGRHLAFVPETTWNVGAQYSGPIGHGDTEWFVRGEYVGVGTYYYDAGNRESESFQLANFRAGIRRHNVTVEGWIRNAFDEDYVLVAFQPSPVDPTVFVGESGAPQTLGVTVSIKF